MEKYLECRSCDAFCSIPGCESGGQIIPCAHVIKPAGAPCADFWPLTEPLTPKPEAPTVTPLLVDELAKAVEIVLAHRLPPAHLPATIRLSPRERQMLERALARHKEEVGDDKA